MFTACFCSPHMVCKKNPAGFKSADRAPSCFSNIVQIHWLKQLSMQIFYADLYFLKHTDSLWPPVSPNAVFYGSFSFDSVLKVLLYITFVQTLNFKICLFFFLFFAGISYFPLNEENENMSSGVIYYNSWQASLSSLKSGDAKLLWVQWLMGCLWPTINRLTIKARLTSQLWLSNINADCTLPFDVQSCSPRLGLSLCP